MNSALRNNPWLSCPKPNPNAALRLFCFPYSGANAALFYSWADTLQPTVEVCPIQLPGRGTRLAEPPFTQIALLVQAIAPTLLPYLNKPFAFFGHSMGALVSFELARYLRRLYQLCPIHLIVAGHGAPQIPDRNVPLHTLTDDEFVNKLRQFKGTPEEVLQNAELVQLILPILRADFAACETYRYEADVPLDCPISAWGGLEDEYVSRVELEAWQAQTYARCTVRMFPGDHFFINSAQSLLLRILARELEPIVTQLATTERIHAFASNVASSAAYHSVGGR